MFNGSNAPSLADIAAVTKNDEGFGGGNGWWVLIILFAIFGGWGNNRGGGYYAGGGEAMPAYATQADVQRAVDQQTLISKIDGQTYGIADLGYAITGQFSQAELSRANQQAALMAALNANNVSAMQNTYALQQAINDCCCENRSAIAQMKYDMATNTCAINTNIYNAVRDLQDAIKQQAIDAKDATIAEQAARIQELQSQASQQAQTAYLAALISGKSSCNSCGSNLA